MYKSDTARVKHETPLNGVVVIPAPSHRTFLNDHRTGHNVVHGAVMLEGKQHEADRKEEREREVLHY